MTLGELHHGAGAGADRQVISRHFPIASVEMWRGHEAKHSKRDYVSTVALGKPHTTTNPPPSPTDCFPAWQSSDHEARDAVFPCAPVSGQLPPPRPPSSLPHYLSLSTHGIPEVTTSSEIVFLVPLSMWKIIQNVIQAPHKAGSAWLPLPHLFIRQSPATAAGGRVERTPGGLWDSHLFVRLLQNASGTRASAEPLQHQLVWFSTFVPLETPRSGSRASSPQCASPVPTFWPPPAWLPNLDRFPKL